MATMRRCGSCGGGKAAHTARTSEMRVGGNVPRVAATVATRYVVNGKNFATMTAAQDYARTKPGAIIKQV